MKPKAFLFATLLVTAPSFAFAQDASRFAQPIDRSEKRISEALGFYQQFLSETTDERIDFTKQINAIEFRLVQLRRQVQEAQTAANETKLDLEELTERIDGLQAAAEYATGVLAEYLGNFESRIHIAEDQLYSDPLRAIRKRIDDAGDQVDERIPALFDAIELGLGRQEKLIGGMRFSGKAITQDGGVKEGSIALIGPNAYFNSSSQDAAGVLIFNSGTIEPGLIQLPPQQAATLSSNFSGQSNSLPIDASQGSAFELKEAKGTLLEHIQKGGWVGYTILALGAFSILLGIYKAISLRSSSIDENVDLIDIVKTALTETKDAALAKTKSLHEPVQRVLGTGIEYINTEPETQMDAMDTAILRYQPKLERFLPFLATTAAVAPLMGLLGTVVGMIKTFTLIEVFGTGDAKSLSSGISEALVTTELGLIVAIPALILHGIFSRIVRGRVNDLEHIAADFSRVSAENAAGKKAPST